MGERLLWCQYGQTNSRLAIGVFEVVATQTPLSDNTLARTGAHASISHLRSGAHSPAFATRSTHRPSSKLWTVGVARTQRWRLPHTIVNCSCRIMNEHFHCRYMPESLGNITDRMTFAERLNNAVAIFKSAHATPGINALPFVDSGALSVPMYFISCNLTAVLLHTCSSAVGLIVNAQLVLKTPRPIDHNILMLNELLHVVGSSTQQCS